MALNYDQIIFNEVPFCHLVIPIVIIPLLLTKSIIFPAKLYGSYASFYVIIFIWLISTLIVGKGWCSWVCFYGGWDDGFSRFSKRSFLNFNYENPKIKYFSFIMLIFMILASLITLTSAYCEWFCPFKLVTEFANINSFSTYIATIIFIILFFSLVVFLPIITRKRIQCTYFCPLGAFQSLLDYINPYKIKIDYSKCIKCFKCVRECPMNSISRNIIENKIENPFINCSKCGVCINNCPVKAISLEFIFMKYENENIFVKFFNKIKEKNKFYIIQKIIYMFYELFSPMASFTFAGYLLGYIIGTAFGIDTIKRFINFFF